MPPKPKKEVEIPVFDLRKPDLGPLDRKFAQGDDEASLSEAFQAMLYVPHTDGYKVRALHFFSQQWCICAMLDFFTALANNTSFH